MPDEYNCAKVVKRFTNPSSIRQIKVANLTSFEGKKPKSREIIPNRSCMLIILRDQNQWCRLVNTRNNQKCFSAPIYSLSFLHWPATWRHLDVRTFNIAKTLPSKNQPLARNSNMIPSSLIIMGCAISSKSQGIQISVQSNKSKPVRGRKRSLKHCFSSIYGCQGDLYFSFEADVQQSDRRLCTNPRRQKKPPPTAVKPTNAHTFKHKLASTKEPTIVKRTNAQSSTPMHNNVIDET